ncbi:SGNH/GDSL hydrolase family protein [Alkalicoccobacillus gibsonii]|uniref:SGNH/GDSL hydrolase family protein n=1 Tax=Alkalicoccobacillus gibsonii TaxID=79881 RepID=UPI001934855E|nr:SGNH/GDSL hydrolase family protein [Alkalicoccobacillus gibsonii]MBM0065922.1 SGNH/GDSL hydrolase family protein [Alkalicoccobacillus gibsonii]
MKNSYFAILVVVLLSSIPVMYLINEHNMSKKAEESRVAYEQQMKEEENEEQNQRDEVESNQMNSLIDYLRFLSLEKEEIVLSVFGSSVTEGERATDDSSHWSGLFVNHLEEEEDISPITLENNGQNGATSRTLVNENLVDEVIETNPDVVLIEPPVIPNYESNFSPEETGSDTMYLVREIEDNLPDTLIIIQSSNITALEDLNLIGYSYEDYNNYLDEITEETNLNYVDVYSGMEERMESEGVDDVSELLADEVHPNDLGYSYWFEILVDYASSTALVEE